MKKGSLLLLLSILLVVFIATQPSKAQFFESFFGDAFGDTFGGFGGFGGFDGDDDDDDGGHNHNHHHSHGGPFGAQKSGQGPRADCKEYLCPGTNTCSPAPIHCPCGPNERKCIVGDWYICTRGDISCDSLTL